MNADLVAQGIVPEWINIPTGSFTMGGGPRSNEQPAHEVEVAAFRLARTAVQRHQFAAFIADTNHVVPEGWFEPAFGHPQMPVIGVNWHDADAYCAWLSEKTGDVARLPSEAEWEWAALGGRQVAYPWGDQPPESLPDYEKRWLTGPESVDAYPSDHPWGLVGMCLNVHEWCSDWYHADYYSTSPVLNPQGPPTGRRKASRGGAWRHRVKGCRITHRSSIPPDKRYTDYGFRLACSN